MKLLLAVALIGPLAAGAQWNHVPYELPQARYAHAVVDDLNHITLCGSVQTETQQQQGLLARLDADGNVLFYATLGMEDKDHLESGIRTQDGHYLWVGHQTISNTPLDINGWAVKTDYEGSILWECEWGAYDGVAPHTIVEWPSGAIMGIGTTQEPGMPDRGSVAHISSAGEVQQIQDFTGELDLHFSAACFNEWHTELYIAGTRGGMPYVCALDEYGELLWDATQTDNPNVTTTGLLLLDNGNLVLSGTTNSAALPARAFTQTYAPGGWLDYQEFSPACDTTTPVHCTHITALDGGGYALTGTACGNAWLCCFDGGGSLLGQTDFDLQDPNGETDETATFALILDNGNALLAGHTFSLYDDDPVQRPLAAEVDFGAHTTGFASTPEFLDAHHDPVVAVTDVLGRPAEILPGQVLFFRHQSGHTEKRYITH